MCDKFYEVLDAVAIYPELIRNILARVDLVVRREINDNVTFDKGMLRMCLDNFKLEEPGIGEENKPATSIFDIPMVLKKSASSEDYDEEAAVQLVYVMMSELQKYISNNCNPKEVSARVKDIIEEQFNKHLESLEIEHKVNENIYRETLFDKVCDTIIRFLESIDETAYAREIQATSRKLRG